MKALDPELPVLLVTGHADVELAVAALKDGVYDFISKPFDGERLATAVGARRREAAAGAGEPPAARRRAEAPADLPLIGDAPGIRRLRETDPPGRGCRRRRAGARARPARARRSSPACCTEWSRRQAQNFVALNCGALPETVLESELFGHEAGAFTGADRKRVGRIEHANGGTLFLDEIESCPPAIQVKLLRVLETREVEPLGTNERRQLDLRVVAATKVDLGDPAARGGFREDLYYRLNVVTLRIPPLRERRGDVPLLFAHFLRPRGRALRPPSRRRSAQRSATTCRAHDWPGNVRELPHFADRVALGLAPEDTPPRHAARVLDADGGTLPERVDRYEAELIRDALQRQRRRRAATIEALGVPRKTFYDKLKRHGIRRGDFDEPPG